MEFNDMNSGRKLIGILAVAVLLLFGAGISAGACDSCDKCGEGLTKGCDREECHGCGECWFEYKYENDLLWDPIEGEKDYGDCHTCPIESCMDYPDDGECSADECKKTCKWDHNACVPNDASYPSACNLLPAEADKTLGELCDDMLGLGDACNAIPREYYSRSGKGFCYETLIDAGAYDQCVAKLQGLRTDVAGVCPGPTESVCTFIAEQIFPDEKIEEVCEEQFGAGDGGECTPEGDAGTHDKIKDNDNCESAVSVTEDTKYCGYVDDADDSADYFSRSLSEGDKLTVTESDGGFPIALLGPDTCDDAPIATSTTAISHTVEEGKAGTYYIRVEAGSAGLYTLAITVIAATAPPTTRILEEEAVRQCMEDCKAREAKYAFVVNLIYALCVILRTLEMIAGILAALILAYSGFQWLASDSPEVKNSAKMRGVHAIVGFIIIVVVIQLLIAILTQTTAMAPFGCKDDNVSGDIRKIICYGLLIIQGLAAAAAAIAIVFSAMELFGTEDVEKRNEAKRRIAYAIIGLIIIAVAIQLIHNLVLQVAAPLQPRFDVDFCTPMPETISAGLSTGILCMLFVILRGIAVVLAVLSIAYSGVRWLTSESAEDREGAKRIIVYTILGVAIVLLVLQLMSVITTGVAGLQPFGPDNCSKVIPTDIKGTVDKIACIIFRVIQFAGVILAVLAVMYSGLRWMASEDPGERSRAKNNVIAVAVGVVVVLLASNFIISLLAASEHVSYTLTCDPISKDLKDPIRIVGCILIGIIEVAAVGIATLVILLAGLRWMTTEDPEERASAKNLILHAVIGLLFVFLAMYFISAVLGFPQAGVEMFTCAGVTVDSNIVLAIQYVVCIFIRIIQNMVTIIAALLIVYAAIRWMTTDSAEDRDHAKSIIVHTIIGAIVIMIATYLIGAVVGGFI